MALSRRRPLALRGAVDELASCGFVTVPLPAGHLKATVKQKIRRLARERGMLTVTHWHGDTLWCQYVGHDGRLFPDDVLLPGLDRDLDMAVTAMRRQIELHHGEVI